MHVHTLRNRYIRIYAYIGLDIDAVAPRLSFFWAIGMNFYMEVCISTYLNYFYLS